MPRARRGNESVFFREHDGQHADCFGRVSWILRSELHVRIVIIQLEKELPPREFKVSKIMLATRIVVIIELGERRDTADYHGFYARRQRIDAGGKEHFGLASL